MTGRQQHQAEAPGPAALPPGIVEVHGIGLRVAVRPGTDPEQPPLVLVNGIGARLELLDAFVDHIDPRIEVIRFDVPGVGGSPSVPVPYTMWMLAELVRRLARQLGHPTYDVLGISWGGGLAQQMAFQQPCSLRRLVLVATATGSIMVPGHPRVLSKMVTPHRYRDAAYAREVAAQLYGGKMRLMPELAGQVLGARPGADSSWGYLSQLLAGCGWSSLPGLPLIRQRTLILAGDDDPIIPLVNARIMKALIRRSELHVYADGHLGLVTSADDLGPRVSRFLLAPEAS
ncbi:MAG: alpha/beta fold hydrolase [Nocardioides sp.]